MKKSELKNIIKESIKSLLKEQAGASNIRINPEIIFCDLGMLAGMAPNNTWTGQNHHNSPWGASSGFIVGQPMQFPNLVIDWGATLPHEEDTYQIDQVCYGIAGCQPQSMKPHFIVVNSGTPYTPTGNYAQVNHVSLGSFCTSPYTPPAGYSGQWPPGGTSTQVYGCMMPNATNYDPNATHDTIPSSCIFPPVPSGPRGPSGPQPVEECSEITIEFPGILQGTAYDCVLNGGTNRPFGYDDMGMCVLDPHVGEIGIIQTVEQGAPGIPEVFEEVPCPAGPDSSDNQGGPTPAPQSPCTNLVVSNLSSLATQQFNCVQNNGTSFPSNSIGKCVIIQGQQYKIEGLDQSTGTTFLNGEIVQCSIVEGAISRMQKLANIKNKK